MQPGSSPRSHQQERRLSTGFGRNVQLIPIYADAMAPRKIWPSRPTLNAPAFAATANATDASRSGVKPDNVVPRRSFPLNAPLKRAAYASIGFSPIAMIKRAPMPRESSIVTIILKKPAFALLLFILLTYAPFHPSSGDQGYFHLLHWQEVHR